MSLREGQFCLTKSFLGWKKKEEGPVSSISCVYVRLKLRHNTDTTTTGMYRQVRPRSIIIVQQGMQEYVFGEFLSYQEHEFLVSELAASGIPARPPQWENYSIY